MSNCPVCGGRLNIQKPFFPLSLIMKDKFICPNCDWTITLEELHKRNISIDGIRIQKTYKKPHHYTKSRNFGRRNRFRRHNNWHHR